jgi:hypothetical protein
MCSEYISQTLQLRSVCSYIGILENEMLGLKESLAVWKSLSMPSVLHIEESASVAGPPPRLFFPTTPKIDFIS